MSRDRRPSVYELMLKAVEFEACGQCAGVGRLVTHRNVSIAGMPDRISESRVCTMCDGSGFEHDE